MLAFGAPRPARRAAARGASLVEVLAMLAVLALVLSTVLPQLAVPAAVPVGQTARQLAADVALARALAIAGRTPYAVTLAPAGGPYASYGVAPLAGPPAPGFPKAFPAGVAVTGPAVITFGPNGGASSDAVFILQAGVATAQVQVAGATGFVQEHGP